MIALTRSLRSLRSGELEGASLRPALRPPTGGAGSAGALLGAAPPDPQELL